jgi:hypothetical protein
MDRLCRNAIDLDMRAPRRITSPSGATYRDETRVSQQQPQNNAAVADDDDALAFAVPGRYVAEELCPSLPRRVRYALGQLTPYLGVDDLVTLGLLVDDQRPALDDVDGWCMRTYSRGVDLYATTMPLDGLRALVSGVDPRRKIAAATLLALADDGVSWAGAALAWLRDANAVARRDLVLSLTVTDLIRLGASQTVVADLPSADMRTLASSARLVNTWTEAERLERRTEAARMEAARAAAEVAIPERVDLTVYAPEPVPWVIESILAWGAVLGLFAERKAGKTTVVREMLRSALDGSPFLGRFAVSLPPAAEVVLFDTEMPLSTLHTQYRRAGVAHLDRLNLRALRGVERSLDVRVDPVRTRWREQIAPGSLIVVDCIYSLFGALGVSENSDEVVSVLAGLRTLAAECDAAGLVIAHHLGKDTERGARGHSSIEGFPDAIARIELDGPPSIDAPRIFTAYGRDVSVEAGMLTLGDDHRLTLGGNPRAERISARNRADDDSVRALIERHPGLSVRGLSTLPVESRGKLSRDRIRESVDRLALTHRIANKGSDAAPEWHPLIGVDPFTGPNREGV